VLDHDPVSIHAPMFMVPRIVALHDSDAHCVAHTCSLVMPQTTKRKGWINHSIKGPESIADHMYRMALMALIADDLPAVNRERSSFSLLEIPITSCNIDINKLLTVCFFSQ
jgi:hypothetical protein